jgi:hypothetical protein
MESSGMDCTSAAQGARLACALTMFLCAAALGSTASAAEQPASAGHASKPTQPTDSSNRYAKRYGIGAPRSLAELPDGALKSKLRSLPAQARARGFRQLQELSFPFEDVRQLRVNQQGNIYYEEAMSAALVTTSQSSSERPYTALDSDQVFSLHSRPGSTNVLYLDFDGGPLDPASDWNSGSEVYVLQPFDPSGNDPTPTEAVFTEDELLRIAEIWHRVAEDFSQFDIDVTTEKPAEFTATTGTVAITNHQDATGRNLPGSSGGGIAYVGKFGQADYSTVWSPALVYYTHLSSASPGKPEHTAELVSHEFGHNLGLSHDGASGVTYYPGHGQGNTSWAPIMGAAFDKNVTTWSSGEYEGANNSQDDISVMSSRLGLASDDHGDDILSASQLLIEADGSVLASTPEEDPENILKYNKGIIDARNDRDWFSFGIDAESQLTIEARPSWQGFRRDGARGANLDVVLRLLDGAGAVLKTSNPLDDTMAVIKETLAPGDYFLEIAATGTDTADGYTDYSSQGMYFIQGWVTEVNEITDTQPPSPGTMAFETPPYLTSSERVSMTAVEATDENGGVEYKFSCVVGDLACADSDWTRQRTWELGGLTEDTYYAFTVRARDSFGNETVGSSSVGVTTPPLPEHQPPVAVADYETSTAEIRKGNHADVVLVGTGSYDPDGVIESWRWTDASDALLSEASVFSQRLSSGTHVLTLTVTDNEGLSSTDTVEVIVQKPDGGNGGPRRGDEESTGGGNGKKPPKG